MHLSIDRVDGADRPTAYECRRSASDLRRSSVRIDARWSRAPQAGVPCWHLTVLLPGANEQPEPIQQACVRQHPRTLHSGCLNANVSGVRECGRRLPFLSTQ